MTTLAAAGFAPLTQKHATASAIGYGMGAGALWGLVFLAPELIHGFSPLQLTAGRYFCYGLIALVLIAPQWHSLVRAVSRREWLNLAALALFGNTLYYLLLSSAVQLGGIAMTSLVIGFLPVAVTVIGSREQGAVPLRALIPSLLLCAAGVVCIGWQSLSATTAASVDNPVVGFFCALGALASWTVYTIGNARCLTRISHVSAHDWNLLMGIVTGAQSLVLIPIALAIDSSPHELGEWAQFGAVSAGIAVLASMGGNVLWNRMSRLLPMTFIGQMILFETLFALLYALLWEGRLPTWLEVAALTLVVLSVLACLASHRRHAAMR